jgi:outer membrane protein, heavy metal efflux system
MIVAAIPAISPVLVLCGCHSADTRINEPDVQVHVGSRLSVSADRTQHDPVAETTTAASSHADGSVRTAAAADPFTEFENAQPRDSRISQTAASEIPASVPLTLDRAIAISLDQNPTLVAQRAADPVAEAALRVAQTYPFNPYVQVEVIPYARDIEGNLGAVKHYVYLMQTLELAHQQRHREASATAALNQVRWNIVQAELLNSAMTERLFFTALYQRDLRDLARRNADLNEELRGAVERRLQANPLGRSADLLTAQATARQSRKQAAIAEANFQTALLALERQINLTGDRSVELVGRLEDFSWLPLNSGRSERETHSNPVQMSPEFAAELAAERPDVRAAQAGTNVADANARLARANMCQNVMVGPYYERDELGTIFVGMRAQMNLPVWDSGRPLYEQREAERQQQCITFDQLRTRAQIEIQTALERYERARRVVLSERLDFARTIPEQLQRVKDQFQAGQADILSVFAVQNSLLQEQRTYLDLLNEVAQAASDVTLAAGLPPVRIISSREPEKVPLQTVPPSP